MSNARAIGLLDMLASHAETAVDLGYTRPRMNEDKACTSQRASPRD